MKITPDTSLLLPSLSFSLPVLVDHGSQSARRHKWRSTRAQTISALVQKALKQGWLEQQKFFFLPSICGNCNRHLPFHVIFFFLAAFSV